MNEPITLKRYCEEQDKIENALRELRKSALVKISENISQRDWKTELICVILTEMYKVFCHCNGICNKLDTEKQK